MASNSFVPDIVPVKGHSRRMPTKRDITRESSFVEEDSQPTIQPPESPIAGGLPMVGGALGGLRGGTAGATTGGMIGEAIRQLVNQPAVAAGVAGAGPAGAALSGALGGGAAIGGAPTDLRDALDRILTQGVIQGGSQATGNAAIGVTKLGGRLAMRGALKFTPEVTQTAIKEGITATNMGVDKMMAKLGEYGQRTMGMIREATRRGIKFQPDEFLTGAEQKLAQDLVQSRTPEAFSDLATFKRLSTRFLRRNQGELSPVDLQKIKTDAQAIADPIYEMIANKEKVSPVMAARARWYKALAEHAQSELERRTPPMIDAATGAPMTLAEANKATGDLIKLKKVLAPDVKLERGLAARIGEKVTSPLGRTLTGASTGAAVGAAVPGDRFHHGLAGAAIGGAAGSPEFTSVLALLLHNPYLLGLIGQAPRAVAQAAQAAQ